MPGGAALVSWLQERDGSAALMLAAMDPEGGRTATVVEAVLDGGRATGFPQLALRGEDAVLAWTQPGEPARIRIVAIPLLD